MSHITNLLLKFVNIFYYTVWIRSDHPAFFTIVHTWNKDACNFAQSTNREFESLNFGPNTTNIIMVN